MSRDKYHGILPDDYYRQLARYETGKKLTEKHSTPSYTSPLGIWRGTAHRWSGRRDLWGLSAEKLVEVADRIAFTGWTTKKGERVRPVGPFGWGVIRAGRGDLLTYLCRSTAREVQRWRDRACRLEREHG